MKATAIVLAAGKGSRVGKAENKVFLPLGGYPVLYWSLKVFQDCEQIDSIIVAAAEGELERVREIAEQYHLDKVRTIIQGGATRLESVKQSFRSV